jgi:MATE family multidrug resistance protein
MSHLSQLSGTPSSLPQDYAILSRFATQQLDEAQGEPEASPVRSEREEYVEDEELLAPPRPCMRTSFPSSYIVPPQPSVHIIPSVPDMHQPTENTPLLAPFMPRIQEDVDFPCGGHEPGTAQMYWEELCILSKYTLPVFG